MKAASCHAAIVCAFIMTSIPQTALASRVWSVDDDGEADHSDIQAAVDEAADGDIIVIKAGDYSSVVISGKSLSLFAFETNEPEEVLVEPITAQGTALRITGLLAGQRVIIRGISFVSGFLGGLKPSIEVHDNEGTVWIEDCTTGYGPSGLHILNSAHVVVVRSLIEGQGQGDFCHDCGEPGLGGVYAQNSHLYIYESTITGAGGTDATICSLGPSAGPGAAGLYVDGGSVFVAGSTVTGGKGGDGAPEFPGWCPGECYPGDSGGTGIHLQGTGTTLRYLDTVILGGAPGDDYGCWTGITGLPLIDQTIGGTLEQLNGTARSLHANSPVVQQQIMSLTFDAQPNDQLFAILSYGLQPFYFPEFSGFVLTSPPWGIYPLGIATNTSTVIDWPMALAVDEGQVGFIEGVFVDSSGSAGFVSAGSAVAVVSATAAVADCNDNNIYDGDDLSSGLSVDSNGNGIPDECSEDADCNANGIGDLVDISSGLSQDCDGNGQPDECLDIVFESPNMAPFDSDNPQSHTISNPPLALNDAILTVDTRARVHHLFHTIDVYINGQLLGSMNFGTGWSCGQFSDQMTIPVELLNIAAESGAMTIELVPDHDIASCEDSNVEFTLQYQFADDCNNNGILDSCDVASGAAQDTNGNGIPDQCATDGDCNGNGVGDVEDIASGTSADCDLNGVADECVNYSALSPMIHGIHHTSPQSYTLHSPPLATSAVIFDFLLRANTNFSNSHVDIALNGTVVGSVYGKNIVASCALTTAALLVSASEFNAAAMQGDVVIDMLPHSGFSSCNPPGWIQVGVNYEIGTDCDSNNALDACEIAAGQAFDINGNGIPDSCSADGDCNGNGQSDLIDIASGTSEDSDGDGVPDECVEFLNSSEPMAPFDSKNAQYHLLTAAPQATGDVTFIIEALSDLESNWEYVEVSLNGVYVGDAFREQAGLSCDDAAAIDQVVVSASTFNTALDLGEGDMLIELKALDVHQWCVEYSYIKVTTSYPR